MLQDKLQCMELKMPRYKIINGEKVQFTSEEETERDLEEEEYQKEHLKTKYIGDRLFAYPSIVDQLDKIYHSGIDEWKKDIKAVKDKFPKP